MSYIGPITSTKEEDEERNRRQDEIVQQVWKPIGSTLNFIGDTQEAVDQVVMPQRRKSIDAASQFVGEQTGSKGLQIGTSILGEFAPDSIDVLLAGAALSGVGTVPALGAIGLRKAMRLHRASKIARKTTEVTDSISDIVKQVMAPIRGEDGRLVFAGAGGPNVGQAFEPNTVFRSVDTRLDDFGTTRAERGKIRTEGITRQRQIEEAELKRQANLAKGKANRAESNIREKRGYLGTPTDFTEGRVKNWIDSNPDPRIRERIGRSDAYGKPIAEGAATKGEYPQFPGQKQSKKINAAIKKDLGLEYTVEQHHLIHLRDSATIGKHLDDLNDPITKAAVYDYMMKRYGIVPGNFDLNIGNIPAGPHRLGVGGDLHTWLDRLGYEDYWGDFSKKWAGKNPTATDILDGFDLYMDEVFHPMMIKLDDLVKNNPTKGKFEGAYVPKYLVDEAKSRIRHLQEPYIPEARYPIGSSGYDTALDDKMEHAYKSGLADSDTYYQEQVGDVTLFSRRHYSGGPEQKKIKQADLIKKKVEDLERWSAAAY